MGRGRSRGKNRGWQPHSACRVSQRYGSIIGPPMVTVFASGLSNGDTVADNNVPSWSRMGCTRRMRLPHLYRMLGGPEQVGTDVRVT